MCTSATLITITSLSHQHLPSSCFFVAFFNVLRVDVSGCTIVRQCIHMLVCLFVGVCAQERERAKRERSVTCYRINAEHICVDMSKRGLSA